MTPKFGPAGNSDSFYEAGNKSSLAMPAYLAGLGLGLYEYQCGKGVKISSDACKKLGNAAKENNVTLTLHAPYYISLSSIEEEKRDKSIVYILQSLRAAKDMGAERIVVHSGSAGSITRKEALRLAKETLKRAQEAADAEGFGDIHICPETMGKVNQLGTVDEVMELCLLDDRIIPAIDFGHVNARGIGCLNTREDFEAVFDTMKNKLGSWRADNFHAHYSRIEYTNMGEKMHHTFAETEYGPEFWPIAEIMANRGSSPYIVCESRGTQTEDAVQMRDIYKGYLNKE